MVGKRDVSDAEHREIIYGVLRKIAAPVALAALTTFAGFGSFCFTQVVPIFEFGIFSSIGVIVAFVVSLTLIPALLIIRGPARKRGTPTAVSASDESRGDTFGLALADSLTTIASHRRLAFACSVIVVLVSVFGMTRLVIDNVMVEYFKTDSVVSRSDRFIREQFGGSKSVSVVVSSKNPGDVLRPDVLSAMDGLEGYMNDKIPEVGKVIAFTDLVKRVNQVFNVDESPDGIAPVAVAVPAAATKPSSDEPAFGFGAASADGEEPAFGFGSVSGSAPAPAKESSVSHPASSAAKPLDEKALSALLAQAVASSGVSTPTADGLVKQLYRATNYRGYAYYEIPTDPARYGKRSAEELKGLVSNYLVLLSGDIHSYADDPLEPKSIRMMVQLRTVGQRDTDRAITAIRDYAADRFPPDVTVKIGGTALVERSLNMLVVQSQIVSVLASLLMVFLILSMYYRSAMAGLIGMIPLSIAVLVNFAVMGFAGIKLNIGTAMVASVAVGTGIDYTIHYMAAYHREYLASGGQGNFVRRTFLSSGKAILFNAVSVGAGFLVLALSQFNILAQLGILVAIGMGTSSLAALTILPALLNLIHPAFITKPRKTELKAVFTEVTK
jgi:predicted RND superfamily exporter protein